MSDSASRIRTNLLVNRSRATRNLSLALCLQWAVALTSHLEMCVSFILSISLVHNSLTVAGIKRPADSMSTSLATHALGPPSVTSFKGGCPGMGLQLARRQILGALEIEEGGDVKRVKR